MYIQSKETGLGTGNCAEATTVTDGLIATSVVREQHGSVRERTNIQQQFFNTRL